MKKRVLLNLVSVAAISVISAIILWDILFLQRSLGQIGLFSIFFVSMISHMTIVARDMFLPLFLSLKLEYNPILLGILAGWGGALGDVSSYFLGWGIGESIRNEQGGGKII